MPCARHQFTRDPGAVGFHVFFSFDFAHISQEICDGLSTVLSTVKTIHAFKPERIFFWLRADWTIVGTLGVGMFTLATIIYQQVCHVMLFHSREPFLSCQTLYHLPSRLTCSRHKAKAAVVSLTALRHLLIMPDTLQIPHVFLRLLE